MYKGPEIPCISIDYISTHFIPFGMAAARMAGRLAHYRDFRWKRDQLRSLASLARRRLAMAGAAKFPVTSTK